MKKIFGGLLVILFIFWGLSSQTVYAEETKILEERQNELDKENSPPIQGANGLESDYEDSNEKNDNVQNIQGFSKETQDNNTRTADGKPYGLKVNLLAYAKNADKNNLSFSWKHGISAKQKRYSINIYPRSNSKTPVYQSGWINSADQTSVYPENVANKLSDNELYYWEVQVAYDNGTILISDRSSFVTAVGSKLASADFLWTSEKSVANLIRAKVPLKSNIEKAMLSVTALDTEAARRNVYNIYVNGNEIGIGPTRRSGNELYYNTFDITSALSKSENIIGLYNYSQAVQSGVLAQLTYYYKDGTQEVIYNSGRDIKDTQIFKADDIVYGTSNQSIGTSVYTELAQNADTTRFPFGWQNVSDFQQNRWSSPKKVAINGSYKLTPSIVDNCSRQLVQPQKISKNSDGSYTVTFAKEIIGDIQLTVSSSKKTSVRITLGEELENSKAKYKMRTGNTYDETWQYQGDEVTFAGFSLKGFRYVTVYNYPGTLTLDKIKGIETNIPYDEELSNFSSDNLMLNSIYELSKYSYRASTVDLVTDSVTRERRAYEGDNLVYQALGYGLSEDYLSIRNTWNYLINDPTQYTEYRLMPAIGVYEDYLRTQDIRYVQNQYSKLKNLLNTVTYDTQVGLVYSKDTVDLIDWPRSELPGYDLSNTKYKTVVNAVACKSYAAMGNLANAIGNTSDANYYTNLASSLKKNMISKLYDSKEKAYSDGLSSSGAKISNNSLQNDYYALAFGIYSDQAMANDIVNKMQLSGNQAAGSIFSAYFFYQGLYNSGNGDLATQILTKTDASDVRTYASVFENLKATIAPEAWSTAIKPNMTFSHAWGTGGGIGISNGIFKIESNEEAYHKYDLTIQPGTLNNAEVSIPTLKGQVKSSFSRESGRLRIKTSVINGSEAQLKIMNVSQTSKVTLDNTVVQNAKVENGCLYLSVGSGEHEILIESVITINGKTQKNNKIPQAFSGEVWGSYGNNNGILELTTQFSSAVLGDSGSLQMSVYAPGKGWSKYYNHGETANLGSGTPITAVKYRLTGNLSAKYDVYYRMFSSKEGWLGWAKNNEAAGIGARGVLVSAMQVELIKKGEQLADNSEKKAFVDTELHYQVHGQSYGWQDAVTSGMTAGTVQLSKRAEALRIKIDSTNYSGSVKYRSHIQKKGWENKWSSDNEISGTTGQALQLEAVQIKLSGSIASEYDIYYRVHSRTFGWLGWAKNGESAGTAGFSYRVEAIQIQLVSKNAQGPQSNIETFIDKSSLPKLSYSTHIQTYGWQNPVTDGTVSGTVGQAKRLEGIKITGENFLSNSDIQYCTHIQSYGWQDWVTNGSLSGTTGKAKRLEAIQIKLLGEMANQYDIYYRVHVQKNGWMGWAKNGERAGTAGFAYRLEAIQIQLVKKGNSAPGPVTNSFQEK